MPWKHVRLITVCANWKIMFALIDGLSIYFGLVRFMYVIISYKSGVIRSSFISSRNKQTNERTPARTKQMKQTTAQMEQIHCVSEEI